MSRIIDSYFEVKMPQKRKAQWAALYREAAKRCAREQLRACAQKSSTSLDRESTAPEVDPGPGQLSVNPGQLSVDRNVVLVVASSQFLDSDCDSDCEDKDVPWDCISSSSEECFTEFNLLSSTVVNQEIDDNFVPDEWEDGFDWSGGFTSSDPSNEHRLPVMESTAETAQCFEDQWIADLSNIPLLASGKWCFFLYGR